MPGERLSRDQILDLQLSRLRWSLQHAYTNVPHYRRAFDAAGVTPDDCRSLADLAKFPFTTKADLRDNYPFGMFAVPRREVAPHPRIQRDDRRATVVGYTQEDLDIWADLMARSIRAAGGRPRRHRARGLRLRSVHRRPRRALRRGAAWLHGGPGVRRHDRASGAADLRLPAVDHHGHAVVHARAARRVRASGNRSAEHRHCRSGSSAQSRGPRRCARRSRIDSTCMPSTSTACPR